MDELADLGACTGGMWTRRQALAATTRGRIDAMVRRGQWVAPWPGVYGDGGIAMDLERRAFAALLACDSGQPVVTVGEQEIKAVACGRLAARLHDLPLVDDDDPATGRQEHLLEDVAVRWGAAPLRTATPDGSVRVLTRHRRALPSDAVTCLPSGLWVTSYVQTIVDCSMLLRPDALVCLLDAALHRALLTPDELDALVARRRRQPGVDRLRTAVCLSDGRAESPHETLTRLVLLPHLPGLVPQQRLRAGSGRILARFDLADRRLRLAVEADGQAGHAGGQMAAKDQRRDRMSDARGWRTERCTWFETRRDQDALVRRMLEAARAQAQRHGLPLAA
jgi:hypothetical protein